MWTVHDSGVFKTTKHSLTYCHNGSVQLQIQLMKYLQKPIAKHSMAIKN